MSNDKMLVIVFAVFFIKHYLSDFPLQTVYMLGKGKSGTQWILPLVSHCLVHAGFTALILALWKPEFIGLTVVDFVIHFVVDRIKATYKLPAGQWKPEEKGMYLSKYYAAFGKDQLAHYLTYALIVYLTL